MSEQKEEWQSIDLKLDVPPKSNASYDINGNLVQQVFNLKTRQWETKVLQVGIIDNALPKINE